MDCARKWLAGIGVAPLVFLNGCGGGSVQSAPRASSAPLVTVAPVLEKPVPVEVRAVGNVEAYSTIRVKAQIGGQLTEVYIREGDTVRKDDPLFLIDPRPYDEAIRQAEANLNRDRALLRQAEAALQRDQAQERFAREQAERYRKLFAEGVIAKQVADQMATEADVRSEAVRVSQAAVETARAAIRASEAALANARLQRSYCLIRSPVDGRAGDLAVKLGNIVKANDVDLVTIHQVRPVFVAFSVPESVLPQVRRQWGAAPLEVAATIPGRDAGPERGKLTFVDNQVDRTTGTIRLKATFANDSARLWPGQFVEVTLRVGRRDRALVVPARAVQTGQSGEFVYVVHPDRTVEMRRVRTSLRVGQELVVEEGLERGETVVTEGQLKLAPKMKVRIEEGRAT
ncbi:MAG: efflux RND transporter periplasmic adaptor subunit [Bryobacteraceae bacterium]|nr:efflux RND transporter periplasmic adaptor subunit [Bryobacteraceae bacterium]